MTSPDGKVCINVAASFDQDDDGRYQPVSLRAYIVKICREAGFDFFDEFVWIKSQYDTNSDGALLGSYPYRTNVPVNQRHEFTLIFRKYVSEEYHSRRDTPDVDDERRIASKLTAEEWREYAQSLWELPRASPEADTEHPAMFPLELPQRLITLYSFASDLVLDPFVGTGTTAVAAKRSGRDYIGIDQNESYIKAAQERLKDSPVDTSTEFNTAPSPPEEAAQYIRDALDRQDPTTLRQIRDYAHELGRHREFIPDEGTKERIGDNEALAGVMRTHNGTIVVKEIPCGKENCSICPHGPYKYRAYRDSQEYKPEYLGALGSDSKS